MSLIGGKMSRVLLGKYVNTHGIKGEIRIKSSFDFKNRVFQKGNKIIIDNQDYEILTYRRHKDFDMVTLVGIDDINKIPFVKNTNVYINREDYIKEKEYLDKDLVGFIAYNNEIKREVLDIVYLEKGKKLLKTNNGYIPFELIQNVNLKDKTIQIMEVSGL